MQTFNTLVVLLLNDDYFLSVLNNLKEFCTFHCVKQ